MKTRNFMFAALASVMVLTGCSSPASDPGAESTDAVVRYQMYLEATSFNPFTSTTGSDMEISSLQFRSLVQVEDNEYVQSLAEKTDTDATGTVWTFTLRETAWSDGEPFTADDVVYSLETYADPDTASPYSGQLANVAGYDEFVAGTADSLSGISAKDNVVTITLDGPNANFQGNLLQLQIVPEHLLAGTAPADLAADPFFREPSVGIGPYLFERWVTDDEIEFSANDAYWEDVKLDTIYAQYLTTDVARAQLETGEIDIAQLAASDTESVEALDNITVYRAAGDSAMTFHTAFDTGKLADPLVRQAILAGIDRQSIVDSVLAGEGTVPATALFTPEWAQDPKLEPTAFDPENAKSLLAKAGWDAKTEVRIGTVPGQRDRDAVVAIVAGQLQAIGMNAVVQNIDAAQVGAAIKAGDFDLFITALYLTPTTDPAALNARLLCDQARPSGINISAYCNPELDKLLVDGISTSDQTERESIYKKVQDVLYDEQPILPLYVPNVLWAANDAVTGFSPLTRLRGAADWALEN